MAKKFDSAFPRAREATFAKFVLKEKPRQILRNCAWCSPCGRQDKMGFRKIPRKPLILLVTPTGFEPVAC